MRHNCHTCIEDADPSPGETDRRCLKLYNPNPQARAVFNWLDRHWLHPNTSMPRRNADGCPGWKERT